MSDPQAIRAVALSEATKLGTGKTAADVVKIAETYLAFLNPPAAAPKSASSAGAEPPPKTDAKPSANTAGAKAAGKPASAKATDKKQSEEDAAAAALAKANAEGAEPYTPPTEAFEATKEGVAAAIAAMIENKGDGARADLPSRDKAIELMKKYKASKVSALQEKPADVIAEFIATVNELFGLGEPEV